MSGKVVHLIVTEMPIANRHYPSICGHICINGDGEHTYNATEVSCPGCMEVIDIKYKQNREKFNRADPIRVNVDAMLTLYRTYSVMVTLEDGEDENDATERAYHKALEKAREDGEVVELPDGYQLGDVEVEVY